MALLSALTKAKDELVKLGYPEEVAENIVSGRLDMRSPAKAERQQSLYPDIFYTGTTSPDIINTPSSRNEIGTGISPQFLFGSESPALAASYAGKKQGRFPDESPTVYPFAIDTAGFDRLLGDKKSWNALENPRIELGGDPLNVYTAPGIGYQTDDMAQLSYELGSPGLLMQDVIDPGPYTKLMRMGLQGKKQDASQFEFDNFLRGIEQAPPTNVVVPDTNRVRSLFAAFDPEYKGSNILGGAATAAVGAGLLAAPEEAEAGPVKTAKDLLFLHNTTADKLARQSAMGGMPNPSIAVTQQDVPFTGFGDISLVGKPEAFDPKLRSNPLYSADAYTVRAPSPVRVANKGAYKQFSSDFAPYRDAGNIDDVAYSLADLETKTRLEPSDFRRVNDFLEYDNAAALKFADDVGIKLSTKDYHEISQMKRDNADKYAEWKDGVLNEYFQGEEFFVTNPDFDRYSGRANLKPYTADNVSRYMTRQAGANKESTMTFGAGNIRASTAERISSLPKAREMKGLLQPADTVAEVKETASMMLGDLQTALRDYYKYDTSSFRYFDEVGEMIALSERKGMKRAMEEIGFEDVPDSLIKEIDDYKDYLRSAPTEYFESKPQRAVQINDFAGAIVPENTSQGVLDMLSRAGLKVEKYGDEVTRTEARKKFQDYMFDAAPTIGGGVGLGLLGMPQESVADTAARLRAESDTSGAYAPRSGLLQNVTMAARDLERRLEGSPASLLFPSGYIQHLEEFNRPYERSTYTGALLGALDFL